MIRPLTALLLVAHVVGCTPADTCRAHSDCGQGRCAGGSLTSGDGWSSAMGASRGFLVGAR